MDHLDVKTSESTRRPKGHGHGGPLLPLSLAALGVVYGDIGTSPLYAIRECFHGPQALAATPANVLGVLSLIIWSLLAVVSVKYLLLVLRADNKGEGGILALAALIVPNGDHGAPAPGGGSWAWACSGQRCCTGTG